MKISAVQGDIRTSADANFTNRECVRALLFFPVGIGGHDPSQGAHPNGPFNHVKIYAK
jgi:hypothetical protein